MTVIDKDKGWKAIADATIMLTKKPFVLVGVQGTQAAAQHDATSELTNVQLAVIHEYGIGVPERSFLRKTVDVYEAVLFDRLTQYGQAVLAGQLELDTALKRVGAELKGYIQQRIIAHIPPPLSAQRIAEKNGKETPLIDTGTLLKSITFVFKVP